jgi:hypothetical protein
VKPVELLTGGDDALHLVVDLLLQRREVKGAQLLNVTVQDRPGLGLGLIRHSRVHRQVGTGKERLEAQPFFLIPASVGQGEQFAADLFR